MPILGNSCWWCGMAYAVLPDSKGVRTYEPCARCMMKFRQGIALFEVTQYAPRDGRPPVSDAITHLWFTGRVTVVNPKEVEVLRTDDEQNEYPVTHAALMEADEFGRLRRELKREQAKLMRQQNVDRASNDDPSVS